MSNEKAKDLGEILFNCKETEQQIKIKIMGEGPKIITKAEFHPERTALEELPVTPVLQIFSILLDQLRGMK